MTAEAAAHAATRFATDTDAVSAALERGALAVDAFLTAMRTRRREHAELMERIMPLGRRLLVGRAEALTDRWGMWWRLRGHAA